ncbi:MAG: hypothetical protein R2838_11705 [Caldilineaceae bacterium]
MAQPKPRGGDIVARDAVGHVRDTGTPSRRHHGHVRRATQDELCAGIAHGFQRGRRRHMGRAHAQVGAVAGAGDAMMSPVWRARGDGDQRQRRSQQRIADFDEVGAGERALITATSPNQAISSRISSGAVISCSP